MNEEVLFAVVAALAFALGFLLRGELGNFREKRRKEKV